MHIARLYGSWPNELAALQIVICRSFEFFAIN